VSCTNAAEVAEAIRSMVVRGAPAIGCAAAFGVALEAKRQERCTRAEFDAAMEIAFRSLAASRPTAVNLFWALDRCARPLAQDPGRSKVGGGEIGRRGARDFQRGPRNQPRHRASGRRSRARRRARPHPLQHRIPRHGRHGTALGVIRSARDQASVSL